MIDYSFMNGTGTAGAQNTQMQQFQQNGFQPKQPTQTGPLASIQPGQVTTQNSGGIADALMQGAPDPVATGNENAGGIMDKFGGRSGASYILASIGQALSAKDPSSWQHQLSGVMKQGAQSQMVQRGQLIAALQQKMGAKPALKASVLANAKSKYNLETPKLQVLPSLSPLAESLSGGV